MNHNPSLQKSLIDRDDERLFSGREKELDLFQRALQRARDRSSIIAISGIGGVGKSTLLRAFVRLARRIGTTTCLINSDETSSAIGIMTELSAQLSVYQAGKRSFKGFRKSRERLKRIESKLNASAAKDDEGIAHKIGIEAAKGGLGTAAGAAIGGVIAGLPGAIAGGALGGALGPIIEVAGRGVLEKPVLGLSERDRRFFSEAEAHLTQSFIAGIKSLARTGTVVLLFDAIENLSETMKWLREELLANLPDKGIVIVLSGRHSLPQNEWLQWEARLDQVEVSPFAPEVAKVYLARRGVLDASDQNNIIEMAAGLPFAMALLTSFDMRKAVRTSPQSASSANGPASVVSSVVDTFLRTIPDETLRNALWVSAIPRVFNAELLALLLGISVADREYEALISLHPAVRIRSEGLALHDVIREYLIRAAGLRHPARYVSLHKVASEYFRTLKVGIEDRGGHYSNNWTHVTLQWVYHELSLGSMNAFNFEFERSSRYYQHSFAKTFVSDVESYAKSIEGVTLILKYHKGQNLIHHNNFEGAIVLYEAILRSPDVEDDTFRSLVTYQLGKAYFWIGRLHDAEEKLAKALSIFSASGNVRMQSHTCMYMSRLFEKLGDQRAALAWRLRLLRHLRILLSQQEDPDQYRRDRADWLFSLGEALRLRKSFTTALQVHHKSAEERRRLTNQFDLGESHIALAKCFQALGQYEQASRQLDLGRQIFDKTRDDYMLADIWLLLGQQLLLQANYGHAVSYLRHAVDLANASQHRLCAEIAASWLARAVTGVRN
jgi:tetratricopeptide (TPR) repeat protein